MNFNKKAPLACECFKGNNEQGISTSVITHEGIDIVRSVVQSGYGSHGRDCGTYMTICQGELYKGGEFLRDKLSRAFAYAMRKIIKELEITPKNFLFVGLGNRELSSDKIGTEIYSLLLPIIPKNKTAPTLSLISPGVLSSGGIEALDHIKGLISVRGFDAVIVADSLSTSYPERLLATVQISNTSITPASGVRGENIRNIPKMREISRKTLGVPVICIGVPTVIGFGDKLYTPYTIDGEIEPICKVIADGITLALTEEDQSYF